MTDMYGIINSLSIEHKYQHIQMSLIVPGQAGHIKRGVVILFPELAMVLHRGVGIACIAVSLPVLASTPQQEHGGLLAAAPAQHPSSHILSC